MLVLVQRPGEPFRGARVSKISMQFGHILAKELKFYILSQ